MTPNPGPPALDVRNLTRIFGRGDRRVPALAGLDLGRPTGCGWWSVTTAGAAPTAQGAG